MVAIQYFMNERQSTMNQAAAFSPTALLKQRLRRTTGFVRALILFGGALLVGDMAWTWISPERILSHLTDLTKVSCVDRITPEAQVMGAAWTLIPVGIILLGLLRLWQLFSEFRAGQVFSPRALTSLRGFACCMMASAIVSPIHGAVLSFILTWVNGPGRREISVWVSSDDYVLLLLGLVLLAMSSVMIEAARVAEDNAGFV
jgi:hypothetical protein